MPRPVPYRKGDLVKTNYGECFVEEYHHSKKIHVVFCDTLTEVVTDSTSLKKGFVRDPMAPKVCGVGYTGCGPYSDSTHREAYSCWRNMISRCYDPSVKQYQNYGGNGVIVCKKWHDFQNFAEWYYANKIENASLDKDLFNKKLYSEKTCVFLPCEINNILSYSVEPVRKNKTGTFSSSVYHQGRKYHKTFTTEEDALLWYTTTKKEFLLELAKTMFLDGKVDANTYGKILETY